MVFLYMAPDDDKEKGCRGSSLSIDFTRAAARP